METIIQLENEAAEALRANGQVVYADAALNVATAFHYDLLGLMDIKAVRYCIEQSMSAGRVVTENLGVMACQAALAHAV